MRWLQGIMGDERLKTDRGERERHPIPDAPDLPLDQRVHRLEVHLAQLWDQVWWMSLPWYKRLGWRALGFSAPIAKFYLPAGDA